MECHSKKTWGMGGDFAWKSKIIKHRPLTGLSACSLLCLSSLRIVRFWISSVNPTALSAEWSIRGHTTRRCNQYLAGHLEWLHDFSQITKSLLPLDHFQHLVEYPCTKCHSKDWHNISRSVWATVVRSESGNKFLASSIIYQPSTQYLCNNGCYLEHPRTRDPTRSVGRFWRNCPMTQNLNNRFFTVSRFLKRSWLGLDFLGLVPFFLASFCLS